MDDVWLSCSGGGTIPMLSTMYRKGSRVRFDRRFSRFILAMLLKENVP